MNNYVFIGNGGANIAWEYQNKGRYYTPIPHLWNPITHMVSEFSRDYGMDLYKVVLL